MSTPAGWYDDGSGRQRWWDGSHWTEHFAPGQQIPAPVSGVPHGSGSKNIWGVLSLIAGLVGIALAWIVFGIVPGILGLVFGFLGLSAVAKGTATNRGTSIWGLILSGVATLLSIIFLVIYLSFGAWIGASGSSDRGADDSSATPSDPETTLPEEPASSTEFPIGDTWTVELSIRAVTLDPPQGLNGEEPTETEYSLDWGPAVETNGEIAVVTATIRSTGEPSEISPTSVSLIRPDLTQYEPLVSAGGYDLSLLNLDAAEGTTQSYEFAYAMPAADLRSAVVEIVMMVDLGQGQRFAVYQPQPGESCSEMQQTDLPEVRLWSCLSRTE